MFRQFGQDFDDFVNALVTLLRREARDRQKHGSVAQAVTLQQLRILWTGGEVSQANAVWQNKAAHAVELRPGEKALLGELTDGDKPIYFLNDAVGQPTARRLPGVNAMNDEKQGAGAGARSF